MGEPIPELITPPASNDPGLDQSRRALGASRWSLQQDHGYIAHNAGLHGTGEDHERGYLGSPQQFRHQPMAIGVPPAGETNVFLPGKSQLVSEE